MKLHAHRAGLPGEEISFTLCPLPLAYKAGFTGHVPAGPKGKKWPHSSF